MSFLNYNVSCILVLPHHMRKGYGRLLIDFSEYDLLLSTGFPSGGLGVAPLWTLSHFYRKIPAPPLPNWFLVALFKISCHFDTKLRYAHSLSLLLVYVVSPLLISISANYPPPIHCPHTSSWPGNLQIYPLISL